MDRDKVLDKIRKCLALGKSPNEHEAAAALRQAQKLMKFHGLSEEDVGLAAYTGEVVVTTYKYGERKPHILNCVVVVVMHALGVTAVFEHERRGRTLVHSIRYFGPRARCLIAVHAHTVVHRACEAAWRAYVRESPWLHKKIGARASFYDGWCCAVVDKVARLAPTEEEAAGIARYKDSHYARIGATTSRAESGTRHVYTAIVDEGIKRAADFELSTPVTRENARLEKL